MNFEFMTIDTPLPPCMPFPRALTGFPVSSTAKVMYCRMLDAMLSKGQEDENGILFVCFPVTAIATVLSRNSMTVKRSLNELETAGLIMRVRQGVGEPNRIYVLIPGKEDAELEQKSSKHIRFTLSDTAQAARILERNFHENHFSIQDDHNLRLHNLDLPVGKIVTAFVENGLEVSEVHTCEESLEDYFKRVTGGEGIA